MEVLMFKKVRIRLTLLSGSITTLILMIMTCGYLYISEQSLLENRRALTSPTYTALPCSWTIRA